MQTSYRVRFVSRTYRIKDVGLENVVQEITPMTLNRLTAGYRFEALA